MLITVLIYGFKQGGFMKHLILLILLVPQLVLAQTYVMTNPQGYNTGNVQIQGNQATFVNPMGYVTQNATIYPDQIVFSTPSGVVTNVIGTTSYRVPSSPQSPPSPRTLQ